VVCDVTLLAHDTWDDPEHWSFTARLRFEAGAHLERLADAVEAFFDETRDQI